MELTELAELALKNVRKTPPPPVNGYRLMGYGTLKTGVEMNGAKMWPVKAGEFIRGSVIQEDGVIIDYPGATRIIHNRFYTDNMSHL